MCHIAICLHFEKSKMAAEIGVFLISMPFDSLPPILSLTPRWLFSAILTKNLTMSRVSRSVSIHNPAYHNPSFPKQVATAIYICLLVRLSCPPRRYQRMVLFSMSKDVFHIMFTLIRRRKYSSFCSYRFHNYWFETFRFQTGWSCSTYPQLGGRQPGSVQCTCKQTVCAYCVSLYKLSKTTCFFMNKDVLLIMFILVRKRKDCSFWWCKHYCECFDKLRKRTGWMWSKHQPQADHLILTTSVAGQTCSTSTREFSETIQSIRVASLAFFRPNFTNLAFSDTVWLAKK